MPTFIVDLSWRAFKTLSVEAIDPEDAANMAVDSIEREFEGAISHAEGIEIDFLEEEEIVND